jgi:hypothetical protein
VATAALLACYSPPEQQQEQRQPQFLAPWSVLSGACDSTTDAHCQCLEDNHQQPQQQEEEGGKVQRPSQQQPLPLLPPQQQQQQQEEEEGKVQQPPARVTKDAVRQRLAFVTGRYPAGRPSRGMIKQVFNFFEARRRGGAGSLGGCDVGR